MIGFWTGLLLSMLIGILIMLLSAFITKKFYRSSGPGAIFGFFLGAGFVFIFLLTSARLYVVTGDEKFDDYIIFKNAEYSYSDGNTIPVSLSAGQLMVINDWDKSVIVEAVEYGGYGFGGDTYWIKPQKNRIFDEPKIFYFYEDKPPSSITTKSSDEKIIRLWLRNKRD